MSSVSPTGGYDTSVTLPMQLTEDTVGKIPHILPRERVFPIQIGGELFKLSGASLSSDAPSYFSQYFLCQLNQAESRGEDASSAIRTLYIDRDPATFRDIALHLQGYHIQPRDGTHFVRLFADAQFYHLPKLVSQLFQESIFISIGHREFQIPRDILTDLANSPNYFSLGFAMFFSQPDDLFPGLDREGLIRPPSLLPPAVPNRNADTFADLLRLLQGYPVDVRDDAHRAELLRDARYFHFKGLEQRLIPHTISYNALRRRCEIVLRLENVQKSGISIGMPGVDDDNSGGEKTNGAHDGIAVSPLSSSSLSSSSPSYSSMRYVNYARPYVDSQPAEMVLEIGAETTKIRFSADGPRAVFYQDTLARVARLLEVVATKLNLPPTTRPLGLLMASGGAGSQPATPGNTPLSENLVRVVFEAESSVVLDGRDCNVHAELARMRSQWHEDGNQRKRRRVDEHHMGGGIDEDGDGVGHEWVVKTGQWRLRIQESRGRKSPLECVLVAVKLDAVSSELGRNKTRGFLMT